MNTKNARYYLIKGQDQSAKVKKYAKTSLRFHKGIAALWVEIIEHEQKDGYATECAFIDFSWHKETIAAYKRKTERLINSCLTIYAEKSESAAINYAVKKGIEIDL